MLGLALEGGGAKGAFHMGAVKAFYENGYKFDGVAGTSIGALNGAIIAQGDFELGYTWWENMDTSLIFDIEQNQLQKFLNRKIDKDAFVYFSSLVKDIIGNKGLDTKRIREVLEKLISEDKIRKSQIDLGIVTVSVSDLQPLELYKEDIPNGKMIEYLMASANFPAFKIEPLDGKFYIDGGFYDNCPINLLARKGYKEVIAIRTLGIGFTKKVEEKNVKVINIIPSENLGGILDFDNDLIHRNLTMGYYDAMRYIKNFKGKMYYIDPNIDNNMFFNKLLFLPEESITKIGEIMGMNQIDSRRMLFEKILPTLGKILKLQNAASYQEIMIGVFERMAEKRKIDRFKIRNFIDFIEEIKDTKVVEMNTIHAIISNMAEKSKLNTKLSKDIILNKVGEELIKFM